MEDKLDMIYPKGEIPTTPTVKGYDFNQGVDYEKLFKSYATTGFQATNISKAIEILKEAIHYRNIQQNKRCFVFFGYTSNMASCGIRDIIRYMAQHKMVDCIVTTCGGIEQDLIKCLADFHLGEFNMDDIQNRRKSLNRIGNILVPSTNYVQFQGFLMPILQQMYKQQKQSNIRWSPSSFIRRLGKQINNPQSIYYWCYKNDIPVFCPAITDGAIGDMLFTFSYKKQGFIIDIVQDACKINKMSIFAAKTLALVLGGGLVKHHILNANIWRNGANYGVFINTGIYQDGSDSGAKISQALTWGKLSLESDFVKIYGQASHIFPIIVAQTFAKYKNIATKLQI